MRPNEPKQRTTRTAQSRTGTRRRTAAVLCHLSSVLLILACGCESGPGNGMANAYYLSPNKDLRRLGRVAMVEIDSDMSSPEIAAVLTDSLFVETQKKQVFSVMVIREDDPTWQSLPVNVDSLQDVGQLATMRQTLGCSGLLVGTVTRYQPYPHMVIGLRLKLLDLNDGQLLWGLEQVWDSSDRSIQKRIRAYSREERKGGQPSLQEELVVVSPLSFCKFVAYEVAGTFERREKK